MRRRIVLFAAGIALFAVVLLAVPLGILAGRGYLREERLELQQAAATVAAQARGDVTTATTAPHVDGAEIRLGVYDRAGRRMSGSGPAQANRLVRTALAGGQASATSANLIAVTAPVSDGDQVIAALLLTSNLDAVHRRALHAWLALAGMCVAAVGLCASGAWLLARRLTRPVDRLTSVAARVGSGDLTARAATSGVAELDTLAETLNHTVARVETMIGRERAFSAEVSHQLRTPLSGLRLELEAAHSALAALPRWPGAPAEPADEPARERGAEDTGSQLRGSLDRCLRAVDRLEITITDVIRLARDLPAGQRVDLGGLLETIGSRWRGQLAEASRPLRIVTASGVPKELPISAAASAQILDMLLDNAYRHGRGAVTIHIRAAGQIETAAPDGAGTVAIEVSDEGPPLTVEAWQMFRRRDRRDGRAQSSEHGIGLPYARRLAEAEGARLALTCTSPPTFALITPLRPPNLMRTRLS